MPGGDYYLNVSIVDNSIGAGVDIAQPSGVGQRRSLGRAGGASRRRRYNLWQTRGSIEAMSARSSLSQMGAGIIANSETAARLTSASAPVVTILLCTLNGERFLAEQLASLERQTFKNWKLIASDDCSTDRTKSILLAFQKSSAPGKVKIIDGPRRGAPANFLFQACAKDLASEYYAFCDQDDVWEADKLSRAIDVLEQTSPSIP